MQEILKLQCFNCDAYGKVIATIVAPLESFNHNGLLSANDISFADQIMSVHREWHKQQLFLTENDPITVFGAIYSADGI